MDSMISISFLESRIRAELIVLYIYIQDAFAHFTITNEPTIETKHYAGCLNPAPSFGIFSRWIYCFRVCFLKIFEQFNEVSNPLLMKTI